jgi:hypothetical protein
MARMSTTIVQILTHRSARGTHSSLYVAAVGTKPGTASLAAFIPAAGTSVFVSANEPDHIKVDRIDTQIDIKTVPAPVLRTMAKQTKFRPAALFLSRKANGTKTYLFIGAKGSIPPNIELRADGSIFQPATD